MKQLIQFGPERCRVPERMCVTTLLICLLTVVGGCSSADRLPDGVLPDGESAIVFRNNTAGIRAAVTESVRKIGVFGYSHPGDFPEALAARFPDYFLNRPVVDLYGNGNWRYDGVARYWPQNGNAVSFFAYAPYIDVENVFALYPAALTDAGSPKISYTVPSDIYQQIDLLWSNALNQRETSNGGVVDFMMNHALTRIDFAVKLDESEKERPYIITINRLSVRNIVGSGVLDLSRLPGDASLWGLSRPADDSGWAAYSLTPDNGGGLRNLVFDTRTTVAQMYDPYDYTGLFADGSYLMLIPQPIGSLGDGLSPAEIRLEYTAVNVYSGESTSFTETLPLSRPELAAWLPGMGVSYRLTLSLMKGTVIEFDIEGFITGTKWVDVNGADPTEGSVG